MDIELYKLSLRTKAVFSYADKKRKLYFCPQTEEIQKSDFGNGEIHERRGYSSEDITGFWNPSSLFDYLKGNWKSFKEGYDDFGFFTAFKFLSLKTPWSGWVWVVDSFETISHCVVDEKLSSEEFSRDFYVKEYDRLVSSVSEEEKNEYLKKYCFKLAPHLWVNKEDITCLYYDPKNKPYSLKDGWSKNQLGEILSEWHELITGKKIKAEYRKGSW